MVSERPWLRVPVGPQLFTSYIWLPTLGPGSSRNFFPVTNTTIRSSKLLPYISVHYIAPALNVISLRWWNIQYLPLYGKQLKCHSSWKNIINLCYRMAATMFVQPLDLVKNRMQLSGEGGAKRQYKTSVHALMTIGRSEGLFALYTGYEHRVVLFIL